MLHKLFFIFLGVGTAGDVVTMASTKAYRELLLPGYAVYATPENMQKYKADENMPKNEDAHSSPYVLRVKPFSHLDGEILSKMCFWKGNKKKLELCYIHTVILSCPRVKIALLLSI